ncbi:MAG: thermonuclease family protein, partial [Dehalococcoidia bacterium]|nr:thermonuclease family protein [Dehalococcoidia bacterium]
EAAGQRGYYGRLLAYIEIDGYDFNESLILRGYARVYEEGTSSREKRYLSQQARVTSEDVGLWGDCY